MNTLEEKNTLMGGEHSRGEEEHFKWRRRIFKGYELTVSKSTKNLLLAI